MGVDVVQLTWYGHSTVWIEDSGTRLLTDPLLRDRLAHLRRRRGATPQLPCAPDAVLVSHLHADHLDFASLRRLPEHTALVVPAGAARLVRQALGAAAARRCTELAVGDRTTIGRVTVAAVPAAHHAGRGPWSRHRAPALGYLVHGQALTWFAGDTGLFDEMARMGPLDLALIPVGGWGPTLGAGHLDPAGAAEAVRRAAAAWAVPIHFGTFWPVGCDRIRPDRFFRPGADFARQVEAVSPGTRVRVLRPGESFTVRRP
ncbi:MBL fold metallo-hydrolase [Micromonospora inositola]|uniref:L-ascorbate metabolism protein UlaG, beta-lactamase superfamily n=1 Tax=Micromonospora inositola TaxID=47865 RepID=A0A1C5JRM6_9ACTN|nr:MBL fold metallo-hydrolase [Micromonospora inositola]SCG73133.1 L-ascorbate metabolism protein UlaG, beta-lactamase superfamily [Micromonospora inositola]